MLIFHNIGGNVDANTDNAEAIRKREAEVADNLAQISSKRSQKAIDRIRKQGRMTAEERVRALCDENAKIWLLQEFAGFFECLQGHQNQPWRAACICALSQIQGKQAIVIANDNTIAAGAWWKGTPEKIQRAQEMALKLNIPVFYLIESAGLYLPQQHESFAGPNGAGAIFRMQIELNRAGVLQLCAVFGDCIAGGGYLPLLCDKIIMTEAASICIGGAALNAHSKGGESLRLGTPDVHVHQSACAEERSPNDSTAIQRLRSLATLMPNPLVAYYRLAEPIDPPQSIQDLYDIIPSDPKLEYDILEVLARLADAGQVQALEDSYGHEIQAALALVSGLPIVFMANRAVTKIDAQGNLRAGGILYREAIQKLDIIRTRANDDGIPIVWIQDVVGFDIGEEAEKQGLLRHGAKLLTALTDRPNSVPNMTLILRKAAGAGYYAMKGSPFEPALIVATAIAKLEVMSPQTLASTLFDKKLAQIDHELLKTPGNAELLAQKSTLDAQKQALIDAQETHATIEAANARGDIDLIVELKDLRTLLIDFANAAYQGAGKARKPQRLWSLLS